MTTPHLRNSISRSSLRRAFLLIAVALCCFALPAAPNAFGVSPAPDGGYPGGNTAEGINALFSLTSGIHNTALGFQTLFSNTTGSTNTASGSLALRNNTAGGGNTASGFTALYHNTTGSGNTAQGASALYGNTTGSANTADGVRALFSNTTGSGNAAIGFEALYHNTTGESNTAIGGGALGSNTTSSSNTAIGAGALGSNTVGSGNTATGDSALVGNTTGSQNTANGSSALGLNTTGSQNTGSGEHALFNNTTGSSNTAEGQEALSDNTTGSNNIAVGNFAGFRLTTGSNNIEIGHFGVAGESNTIRIGTAGTQTATFIAGVSGATTGLAGVPVLIDANGQLGTMSSSRRFKKEIKPMDQTSEAILGLQPVTFQYKSDTKGTAQFGLIAEEVDKVNPDLVVRDANGEIYTVRYEAVNTMLLNEFLKEHRKVTELETTVVQLKSTVAEQQKDFKAAAAHQQEQIEALTAGLQRVSAQVEMSRPAPQMVLNNR